MKTASMVTRTTLVMGLGLSLLACSGDGSEEIGDGPGADSGVGGDAAVEQDAGTGEDAAVSACPSTGTGTLELEVVAADGVEGDVRVAAAGAAVAGSPFASSTTIEVSGGRYDIEAGRVHVAGEVVGAAYQGAVEGEDSVCVRAGETTTVRVVYTEEPGSQKLWVTNANGEGSVLAFGADVLTAGGDGVLPAVTLDPEATSASALRVDALGRLWVGDRTGRLVAFDTARLGATSTDGPDVVLDGPTLCGEALPCGPRALAFDAEGALWVALLDRVVKLAPASLEVSGQPTAEVTITSPDLGSPISLAFDAEGNLWAGDLAESGVVKFDAERLTDDIEGGAADVVIFTQSGPPVIGQYTSPDGLAFDAEGNLWVGYFSGNDLVRLTPADLTESATLTPSVAFKIGVLALVTDLAVDEAGNLWMPGGSGSLARIAAAQLGEAEPEVVNLSSPSIGNVEKLALHAVAGGLFVAP